jgi:uncharacterized protein YejL (UPF0352 family)
MIKELTIFYKEKEDQLQALTGLKDSEFKKKIGAIIKQVRQNYYNQNITGIKDLDDYFEALKGNEKAKKRFLNNKKALNNGTKAWLLDLFKDKEFKKYVGTDKEQLTASVERYKNKVELTLIFLQDYVSNLMGPNTPDATMNAMMELILTGKMPKDVSTIKGKNKTTINSIKEITDGELKLLNRMARFQSPTTAQGGIRKTVHSRSANSYANSMVTEYGSTLSEVSASRLLDSVVKAAAFNTVGELERELTGNKNIAIDISDFILKATFSVEGKPFQIGVDVKYSLDPNKAGKVYTRKSSDKSRFFVELEHLFIARELKAVTYLLTNLYFHKGSSDQEYKDYFDQIMQLITFTGGLRTLLPTSEGAAIDFKNPRNVQKLVESDTRMFVMLNQNLFLMTTFLQSIDNSLFQSGLPEGSSVRKALMNNFASILDSINSGNNIGELTADRPTGPFYAQKLKVLKTTAGSEVYRELKSQVSDPVLSMAILGWRYKGLNIPLVIKGA